MRQPRGGQPASALASPLMAAPAAFAYIAAHGWRISGDRQARGLRFLKMHGLGNDFVVIDARGAGGGPVTPALARALGDRHRGSASTSSR